jgi:ABC-2 type transport system permease protein
MAVYRRGYRPYAGPLTPEWSRFLVPARYALSELFASRLLSGLLVLCVVPFLFETAFIYVVNSTAVRALLRMPSDFTITIGGSFFLGALMVQCALAFLLTAWAGPTLVSPDLVNGALPLYLSRPFSRAEYVLGKASVLFGLLSLVTWVPVLLVFSLQSSLAGTDWLTDHRGLFGAIFLGAWVWIVVLTLLALALSAWIRWRIVASAALFGCFFVGMAFGEMWREVLQNPWGRVTNLLYLVGLVWRELFALPPTRSLARMMLDDRRNPDLPTSVAVAVLLSLCTLCLYLLHRRIRAHEVVR